MPFPSFWRCAFAHALGLSLLAAAFSTRGADSSPIPKSIGTNSLKLPAELTEVCFFVEAHIGTNGPYNLVLDTGASYLVLSPQVARTLRETKALRDTGSERVATASSRQPKVDFAEVRDVRLGDYAVRTARAAIFDLSILSKILKRPVDGIAGMELFELGTLVLDFHAGEVRMETLAEPPVERTVILPCRFKGYRPIVQLEVAGEEFAAAIDSGFNESFALPLKDRKLPFVAAPITVSLAANAADITEEKAARLATNIIWGGATFERPIVRMAHTSEALIGRKTLSHFVVRLDQPRSRVLLTRRLDAPIPSLPTRSLGFSLLPDEKGLKVMAVIPDTDAARAGIRRGDYISSVNGEPAGLWTQDRLRSLHTNESFEIEMFSQNKTNRFELKVSTLVE